MSQISLSVCPICYGQDTLSYEKMEVRGRSHEWYECAECGSALLWLGDDQWAYQKVGREDKAHLLKNPMSEEELLALLPEQEDKAPAPQAGDESLEMDEEALTSLFSRDWPEYDEDPFAFLFQSAPEEDVAAVPPSAEKDSEEDVVTAPPSVEEEPEEDHWEPTPAAMEEVAEAAEPGPASEAEEDLEDQEMEPFAALFAGEWEEAEEPGPSSVADEVPSQAEETGLSPAAEEVPSQAEQESPAMFSRAWFEEMEAAEFSPATDEEISDLEEVAPGPDVSDDWLEQEEDTPTLVAEKGRLALEEAALIPEARGDLPAEVEGATTVTVSRDLPEEQRGKSPLGRLIPWLLALCVIAFLFLVGVAVYQIVSGSSLF